MPFANSSKTDRKTKSNNNFQLKYLEPIEYFLAVCAILVAGFALTISLAYSGYIDLDGNGISGVVRKVIFNYTSYGDHDSSDNDNDLNDSSTKPIKPVLVLDRDLYDKKIHALAHREFPIIEPIATSSSTTTAPSVPVTYNWPVKTDYPRAGAILPFKRVVAYYGNLYSRQMGALGEYPEDEMLARLGAEVEAWTAADPETPAIPALHYIVETAQLSRGEDGKYRSRMPFTEVDKVLAMADKIGALVFLDFQIGLSTLAEELPIYSKYYELPNVHVGLDPEFAMLTSGRRPGTVVGTMDAADINFASEYLADIVKSRDLPPKILVVHRYTRPMVTNYKQIITRPEIQIVVHMDGWGDRARKLASYREYVYKEPVQFAGFKLFYKNDIRGLSASTTIMTPAEVIKLNPAPIYIQYQ